MSSKNLTPLNFLAVSFHIKIALMMCTNGFGSDFKFINQVCIGAYFKYAICFLFLDLPKCS